MSLPPLSTALLAVAIGMAMAPLRAQEAVSSEPTGKERATTAPTATPKTFDELDANADGGISKDEAAVDPALAEIFGTLDKDADGRLTPEEYAAYSPSARP